MKKTASGSLEKLRKLRGTLLAQEKEKAGRTLKAAEGAKEAPASVPAPAPLPPKGEAPSLPGALKLSDESLRKLGRHGTGGAWAPAALLERLIHDNLHGAYAEITYRGVVIASHGLYRAFDRKSHRPGLRLLSDQGEFFINTRSSHGDYERWLATYQNRLEEKPHEAACAMCAFELQQRLETYGRPGETHLVYPEEFLVERLA